MRMSAYEAPSTLALVSAASANALFTASTSAASAASRSITHGASVTVPTAVEASFRKSRRIMRANRISGGRGRGQVAGGPHYYGVVPWVEPANILRPLSNTELALMRTY